MASLVAFWNASVPLWLAMLCIATIAAAAIVNDRWHL